MVGLKHPPPRTRSARTRRLEELEDVQPSGSGSAGPAWRGIDEASPPLNPPFPFERIHPRLRDWVAGKQYWLAIVVLSGLGFVVAIEMFTSIDLGRA